MVKQAKLMLILPAALALSACPGSTMGVEMSSVSDGIAPPVLVFDSQVISLAKGEKPEGWQRVQPVPFSLVRNGLILVSGDETIWQLSQIPDDARCNRDAVPSRVIYGQVPECFVAATPAKPLEVGRAYLYGWNQQFVWDEGGVVRPISHRTYKNMTKQYLAE